MDLLSLRDPGDRCGFDPARPDRHFDYSIGRRPGFVDGKPGFWWSINGHLFPTCRCTSSTRATSCVMQIDNHSGEVHPMHLHGHHAVVLSRDGRRPPAAPGGSTRSTSRTTRPTTIAFVADNPGIWMDHCHNLKHAAQGLVAHLMYDGVTDPYRVGGDAGNEPE